MTTQKPPKHHLSKAERKNIEEFSTRRAIIARLQRRERQSEAMAWPMGLAKGMVRVEPMDEAHLDVSAALYR